MEAIGKSPGGSCRNLLEEELTQDQLSKGRAGEEPESLEALDERIAALEETARRRTELESTWGHLVAGSRPSFLGRLPHALRRASVGRRLARTATLESVVSEYQRLIAHRSAVMLRRVAEALHRRLRRALAEDRATLRQLVTALRGTVPSPGENIMQSIDPAPLLRALPLWLVTFDDLPGLVPLAAGIFDLALIDEATQCDLAAPLPAMYRARRVMVSGDARQLRHLSFLADERQKAIAELHGLGEPTLAALDYRRRSLLDLVEDQCVRPDQVVRLREHYRSHPAIISFSNDAFYRGSLRIMTRHPGTLREPGLELRRVDGRRRPEGHNPEEVDAVVEEVLRRVGNETLVADERCSSMGVLSPFRDQVDRLASELEKALSRRAAERHRLLVGTAHDFQGDERDVMLISFAIDGDAPAGTLRYLDRPDVFNVSITRARSHQCIFCSVPRGSLPPDSLIRRYLESIRDAPAAASPWTTPEETPPFDEDPFLRDVRDALAGHGFETWVGWPVAGTHVDLVVQKDDRCLGVDLVGSGGPSSAAHSLDHYRMLGRAGLEMVPLSYSRWCREREACLKELRERTEASQLRSQEFRSPAACASA